MKPIKGLLVIVLFFAATLPAKGEDASKMAIERAVYTVILYQLVQNVNRGHGNDPVMEVEILDLSISSINKKPSGVYNYHFVKGSVTFNCKVIKDFTHKNTPMKKGEEKKLTGAYQVKIVEDGFGQMVAGAAPLISPK